MAQQDHLDSQSMDEKEQASPTKEQEIAWLYQIINREVDKPEGEVDYDLVMECTDFLSELTSADTLYSVEEIEEKLKQVKSKIAQAKQDTKTLSVSNTKKQCKPWLKVVAALAAVFTVFFTTLSVVARTQGYNSTWEYVVTNARRIAGLHPGEQIDEDGITITKPTGTATYATIEELLEQEDLHILYPTNLPDGVKLESIVQTYQSEDKYSLLFVFSNESYIIHITNYSAQPIDNSKIIEVYDVNNVSFRTAKIDETLYVAICQHNGFEYSIHSTTYEELINLLNGMKGY